MSKWKERKKMLGNRPPRVFATTDAEDDAAEAAEKDAAKNKKSAPTINKTENEEPEHPG